MLAGCGRPGGMAGALEPGMYVDAMICEPERSSRMTKMEFGAGCATPGIGPAPAMTGWPALSTTMPPGMLVGPRNVDQPRLASEFSFARKPGLASETRAPGVIGKAFEVVLPAT